MTLQEKIEYNKKSALKMKWNLSLFGATDFNAELINLVEKFQKEMGIEVDGLVGPITHRLITTKVQSEKGEFIICDGQKVPISWGKVITMGEPGSLGATPKGYRKNTQKKTDHVCSSLGCLLIFCFLCRSFKAEGIVCSLLHR